MATSDSTSNSGIYIILNMKNGNVYIGKTINLKTRWRNHRLDLNKGCHHNSRLQNAWNKYGSKTFKFFILEYCEVDELDKREKHHIRIYKSHGLAYNLTDGGDGALGHIVSEEARRKISMAQKGKKEPPRSLETRQRLSDINRGKKLSPKTCRKMSEANKGKPAVNKGVPHSSKTKQKMSIAKLGNKYCVGRVLSEETRLKISEAQKRAWERKKNGQHSND